MKQKTVVEEVRSQVDKKPSPTLNSLADLPLWLITSIVLFLVSLLSLIHYFFLKGLRSKSRRENYSASQVPVPKQTEKTVMVRGEEMGGHIL